MNREEKQILKQYLGDGVNWDDSQCELKNGTFGDLLSGIIPKCVGEFIAEAINKQLKQEEELFITALRTMAEPPIKGEITKGKIRWRGIRIIRQQIGLDSYSWLEQRGKQISPKFHIEAKLPDLNVG